MINLRQDLAYMHKASSELQRVRVTMTFMHYMPCFANAPDPSRAQDAEQVANAMAGASDGCWDAEQQSLHLLTA